ncbi:helix-turn-helix domain-containing protein [Peptostreptococcaceae bacterium AGR-M142]
MSKSSSQENYLRCTCPMEFTMNTIAGKWKLVILWHIYEEEVLRYGQLKKKLNNITHKMLSNQLKELVSYDLVHKKVYNQIPPKTEYTLTNRGKTLIPILDMMYEWGVDNMDLIKEEISKIQMSKAQ